MTPEERTLLKEEYFHVQKVVEDFDQRGLTIKAWSITTSMVGIAASYLHDDAYVISLLAAFSSLTFWIIEAMWKSFQQCYYPRLWEIEKYFASEDLSGEPLQISSSWSKAFHKNKGRRFIRSFFWPHVMLPHVLVVAVGASSFVLRRGLLRIE